MENYKHYIEHINNSIRVGWNATAFRDYQTDVRYTYGKTAEMIKRLGVLYDGLGLPMGTKIAICGSNSSNIAISILSTLCNGMVSVMILPDFTGDDIVRLVNHSDADLLIASEGVLRKINPKKLNRVKAVINAANFTPYYVAKAEYYNVFDTLDDAFAAKYPHGITENNCSFRLTDIDDLAVINYTSGTTSEPKGVMLSHRALSSNIQYSIENMECHKGITLVSMLPLAHMFGFTIELLYNFSGGAEVCFITRLSTQTIMSAFKECRPIIVLTVPLVLEKIYEKNIKPIKSRKSVRLIWNIPIIGWMIKKRIRNGLIQAFGGNLYSLIVGGAALLPEVEKCLVDIRFPYVIGYGMTECAPLVTYENWKRFEPGSCGKMVDRMKLWIDSDDERRIPGEILLKGDNVMMGYYKNKEATDRAFTVDGWLRTGDMGVVDGMGNLFLKGRCKSMILGSSGQNIYPEEIEKLLNAEPCICESLLVKRENALVALIFPEKTDCDVKAVVDNAVRKVNSKLPAYSKIKSFVIRDEEFEKTPKLSIKRHLYQ